MLESFFRGDMPTGVRTHPVVTPAPIESTFDETEDDDSIEEDSTDFTIRNHVLKLIRQNNWVALAEFHTILSEVSATFPKYSGVDREELSAFILKKVIQYGPDDEQLVSKLIATKRNRYNENHALRVAIQLGKTRQIEAFIKAGTQCWWHGPDDDKKYLDYSARVAWFNAITALRLTPSRLEKLTPSLLRVYKATAAISDCMKFSPAILIAYIQQDQNTLSSAEWETLASIVKTLPDSKHKVNAAAAIENHLHKENKEIPQSLSYQNIEKIHEKAIEVIRVLRNQLSFDDDEFSPVALAQYFLNEKNEISIRELLASKQCQFDALIAEPDNLLPEIALTVAEKASAIDCFRQACARKIAPNYQKQSAIVEQEKPKLAPLPDFSENDSKRPSLAYAWRSNDDKNETHGLKLLEMAQQFELKLKQAIQAAHLKKVPTDAAFQVPEIVLIPILPSDLIAALRKGQHALFQQMLAYHPINVNLPGYPLIVAAGLGNVDAVKCLLAMPGISVTIGKGDSNTTALVAAAEHGHVAVVELLLAQRSPYVNVRSQNGAEAFLRATLNRHSRCAELILSELIEICSFEELAKTVFLPQFAPKIRFTTSALDKLSEQAGILQPHRVLAVRQLLYVREQLFGKSISVADVQQKVEAVYKHDPVLLVGVVGYVLSESKNPFSESNWDTFTWILGKVMFGKAPLSDIESNLKAMLDNYRYSQEQSSAVSSSSSSSEKSEQVSSAEIKNHKQFLASDLNKAPAMPVPFSEPVPPSEAPPVPAPAVVEENLVLPDVPVEPLSMPAAPSNAAMLGASLPFLQQNAPQRVAAQAATSSELVLTRK